MTKRLILCAGLFMSALLLTGCGGGGGGGASAARSTTISGQAVAPSSQTRAARPAPSRADDMLVPVDGATVTVHDLTTDTDVATAVTDNGGHYTISGLTPGHNYLVRITKNVPAGTLTLKAVVTAENGENQKDITPATTVAAAAVEVKLRAAPELKTAALEAVADELEKKAPVGPPPNLTDDKEISGAAQTLITSAAPNGSYFGTYDVANKSEGNSMPNSDPSVQEPIRSGKLCALFANGKFLLCAFGLNADGKPIQVGFAKGAVDAAGNVTGKSDGGNVTLRGTFSGDAGTGTWTDANGGSGTWQIKRTATSYAGLYAGLHMNQDGSDSGMFALAILEDKTAWAFAVDERENRSGPNQTGSSQPGSGQGTPRVHIIIGHLNDDNTLSLSRTFQEGGQTFTLTINGTLNVSAGSVQGTFSETTGSNGTWSGSRLTLNEESRGQEMPPPPPSRK